MPFWYHLPTLKFNQSIPMVRYLGADIIRTAHYTSAGNDQSRRPMVTMVKTLLGPDKVRLYRRILNAFYLRFLFEIRNPKNWRNADPWNRNVRARNSVTYVRFQAQDLFTMQEITRCYLSLSSNSSLLGNAIRSSLRNFVVCSCFPFDRSVFDARSSAYLLQIA